MSDRFRITDAFMLHVRPYRENGYWCDLLTRDSGRVRCLFSGRYPEYFRLFQLKLVATTDAFRASDFRYTGTPLLEDSDSLLFGLYVNELCVKTLPLGIEHNDILPAYATALAQLQYGKTRQQSLRQFEQSLLTVLGVAIDYYADIAGQNIDASLRYQFEPLSGFRADKNGSLHGNQIQAIGRSDFSVSGALAVARSVQQMQLLQLLENRPLNSVVWQLGKPGGAQA